MQLLLQINAKNKSEPCSYLSAAFISGSAVARPPLPFPTNLTGLWSLPAWLPDGKIGSLPFLGLRRGGGRGGAILGKEGIKFCHLANLGLIKYGVISRAAMLADLLDWESLYAAGRLHKPVRFVGRGSGGRAPADPEMNAALR